MIREEYIEEIKKYILSAKIEKVYNADLVVENDDNSLLFPSFEQIFEYVNKADNVDKFFNRIFKTLNNYEKYIKDSNDKREKVSLEPLEKRLKMSEDTINKLLAVFGKSFVFDDFGIDGIVKITNLVFNDRYSDSLNFLFDLLIKLAKKVKDYIIKNSIWNTAYKIRFDENINTFNNYEPREVLSKANEEVKKILDKKYIPDFLSDGTGDLVEMMNAFWLGLGILLFYSKPIENVSYEIKDNGNRRDIKDWLKAIIQQHYSSLDRFLSHDLFSEYKDIQIREFYDKIIKIKIPKEINPRSESDMNSTKCEAAQKLDELIGLDSVKEAVDKIITYTKLSKGKNSLNLHMAFYGNPGTGKTEVAKLIGEILYENGVLPKKSYVEATRSDLVGRYIGETAIKTQALIEEAMGGVLFIDEAYSLAIEGDSMDYGNEAVAELIKQMEDRKGEFCVILAGYKNKLKKMLSTNPGFNSRIQFHIDFENFTRDEMSEIFKLMLDNDGYTATEEALNKMLDITDVLRKNVDFANARDARNIIQQCVMCLSIRTGDPNDKTITIEDVNKYIKDTKINLPTNKSTSKVLTGEEELDALVGLENVKTNIKKIRAYAKKNKDSSNLNLHMAFTGNPGTGKTEVAHIISRVLYEAGVLPEAKVVIGSRETIVGQYVGQTAIKTKEAVEKAMGGVLFIDEAYSLASSTGSNDYGSEAIATLIDEMEKNKGKLCVIVAGYEMPLKQMIASNHGFGSRIQFWIDFPDYSRDELREIILRFIEKETIKYTITNEALEEMLNICDFYRSQSDFANARTARKMVQDIIMNQNLRVEDELDNNEIIIDDVMQYAVDNELVKQPSPNDQLVQIDKDLVIKHLMDSSTDFDFSKVDNNYLEQAVISISDESSQGTGFIITPDGFCLTCAHCIAEDGSIQKARVIISLDDGQKLSNYVDFDLICIDKFNDFALIKIKQMGFNYKYLPLEIESKVKLDPLSEFIMAGYPFGGESFSRISLTKGSIASVNKTNGRTVVFADMFGKPGSSGSPIIDIISKKVIGIFWGGITSPDYEEKINCFTGTNIIWKSLKG